MRALAIAAMLSLITAAASAQPLGPGGLTALPPPRLPKLNRPPPPTVERSRTMAPESGRPSELVTVPDMRESREGTSGKAIELSS